MALRLKEGMELQIVITAGKGGAGFDLQTRSKISLHGQCIENETSRRHVDDEAQAWILIQELAAEKLVELGEEVGA